MVVNGGKGRIETGREEREVDSNQKCVGKIGILKHVQTNRQTDREYYNDQ